MFTRTETLGLLLLFHYYNFIFSSPCLPFKLISGGSAGKESLCNVGDLGSIPGLGRSPEEWKVYSSILAWRSSWTNPVLLFFVCKLESPREV